MKPKPAQKIKKSTIHKIKILNQNYKVFLILIKNKK